MCRAMGCVKVMPVQWEQCWDEADSGLKRVMEEYWQVERVSIARPARVVRTYRNSGLWQDYAQAVTERRAAQAEELREAKRVRKEKEELDRINTQRARQEKKDKMAADKLRRQALRTAAREARQRLAAEAEERRELVMQQRQLRQQEIERARLRREEVAEQARQEKIQQLRRKEQEEVVKRDKHKRTKRPLSGNAGKPGKAPGFLGGWLHRTAQARGRTSKWVKGLGTWTKVQTVIQKGWGNYIKAAVKSGWVEWHAVRPSECHIVNPEVCRTAQVHTTTDEDPRISRPTRTKSRRASKRPMKHSSKSSDKQAAVRQRNVVESVEGSAPEQTERGDYFHDRGWP